MNIYLHKDGTQYGPYTLEQLQQYIQKGSFTVQDQACYDGQNWVTVAQVPGISQAATPQAQPAGPQAQPAAPQAKATQAAPQGAKASTAQAASPARSKKKVIIWSSIAVFALAAIITTLLIIFSGEETEGQDEGISELEGKQTESGTKESNPDELAGTLMPEEKSLPSIPLLSRIPADAGMVFLTRLDDLLSKGGDDIFSLLPPNIQVSVMVKNIIQDPSTIGLDLSEPLQAHLSPAEGKAEQFTLGVAGKLSDREKFKNTFELVDNQSKPIQKDGYELYQIEGNESLAIGPDFFYLCLTESPVSAKSELVKFMKADGSDGLLSSQESFSSLSQEKHDFSIWFGGDSIWDYANFDQIDQLSMDSLKGSEGKFTLNFEAGEMRMNMRVKTPNDELVYGKGEFSDEILKLTPSDAIFSLGFATDLPKFLKYLEKDIISEFEDDFNADEPIAELGNLSIRDVINTFTGEFMLSLTDIKMPDPTSLADAAEDDPFGDIVMEEMEDMDALPDAAGSEDAALPMMDPTAMLMAAMPKPEFIIGASIDSEKWATLKASPPLAMGLGLAMMQGYAVTEKDGFLIITSKDHIEASQSGKVANPVSGNSVPLYKENDFVMIFKVEPLLDMGLPIPPGEAMDMLKKISHLEAYSNSGQNEGTGTFRIVFTDSAKNSFSTVVEMITKTIFSLKPESEK